VKVLLDTNVLVSGIFFGGVPGRILEAWRQGRIQLVLSAEILGEYQRVGHELAARYSGADIEALLGLLAVHAEVVAAPALAAPVSSDADDDKFLACALAAGNALIVSGDKHLLDCSGWRGIRVLRPRRFADEFLTPSLS